MKSLILSLIFVVALSSQNCSAKDDVKLLNNLVRSGFKLISGTTQDSVQKLNALTQRKLKLINVKANESINKLNPIEDKVVEENNKLKSTYQKLALIVNQATQLQQDLGSTSRYVNSIISTASSSLDVKFSKIKKSADDLENEEIEKLKSELDDLIKKYNKHKDEAFEQSNTVMNTANQHILNSAAKIERYTKTMEQKLVEMKNKFLNEIDLELKNRKNNLVQPGNGPVNSQDHGNSGGQGDSESGGNTENTEDPLGGENPEDQEENDDDSYSEYDEMNSTPTNTETTTEAEKEKQLHGFFDRLRDT